MAMNLVDGRAGRPHINSDVLAVLNKGVFGEGNYVFDYGDNLSAVLTNANTVQIGTGALVVGGLRAINDAATNVTIQSGGQAQKRNDIIVARYNRTGEGDSIIESCDFAVVKGTPVSYGDATDPEIEQGDMPLWRITIDGITPGEPEQMFEVLPSIDSLRDSVSQTSRAVANMNMVRGMVADTAAEWIYATAYECSAGLVIGGNFSPGYDVNANAVILTVTLSRPAVAMSRNIMRGVFHGHQSGAWVEVSGNKVTMRLEQATSFKQDDTFSCVVPIAWA